MRHVRVTVSRRATATSPPSAAASEADLAPLRSARSAMLLVASAFVAQEGEEFVEVLQHRQSEIGDVFVAAVQIAIRQREELLLQRNGILRSVALV
jgi:hypothetical protein